MDYLASVYESVHDMHMILQRVKSEPRETYYVWCAMLDNLRQDIGECRRAANYLCSTSGAVEEDSLHSQVELTNVEHAHLVSVYACCDAVEQLIETLARHADMTRDEIRTAINAIMQKHTHVCVHLLENVLESHDTDAIHMLEQDVRDDEVESRLELERVHATAVACAASEDAPEPHTRVMLGSFETAHSAMLHNDGCAYRVE